jgi:virulence factor Mce-like protein
MSTDRPLSPLMLIWRRTKLKLYGLAFLAVVTGLVGLTILIYTKSFTKVVTVSLRTDHIGNQLGQNADVKLRGLPVGEVRSVRSTGEGAILKLALNPSDVAKIPNNVEARILPKTLFGEKFVDLVVPAGTTAETPSLRAGDVIPQDRSVTAIELGKVFDDVVPLLRAVQPAQLNQTLNALATALQGRSDTLGQNLTKVDTYFKAFNPALPQLDADISGLADFADTYSAALPNLLTLLSNQATTSNTLAEKNQTLVDVLRGTRGFTDTLTRVLTRNENNFIRLASTSRPVLDTLRDDGQQIPYIFHGLTALTPRINGALGGGGPWLHITAQLVTDRGPYTLPRDCPRYPGAAGPNCPGASSSATVAQAGAQAGYDGNWVDPAGTRAEARQVAAIVAAADGGRAQDVGEFADLLFAPLLRGTQVSLS